MDLRDARYIVGIDLGTTNTAVSYVDRSAEETGPAAIRPFAVPQLAGPGEFAPAPVLPSFLYLPGDYDIDREAIALPWRTEEDAFAGAFARDHGATVPGRLVASAKSWLCHSGVDRRSRILPWGADEEVPKVSPVEATARYLRHIRRAWNLRRGDDAEAYLENQFVTVTVPASFDQVARDLTLEAAAAAGLSGVTLLEEPLAAFYSWLLGHENRWAQEVRPGELILVCDVGGGTTDFTLIALQEAEGGTPRFERIAVGDHLILGGDNIDLALARRMEADMSRGGGGLSLSSDRWKALCQQCRQAKEAILGGETDQCTVTLMGGGGKLIAGTRSARLDRETVESIVLEGFFPVTSPEPRRTSAGRKGIAEFGLPYESEPAITRHIGWFLESHRKDVARFLGRDSAAPDRILFNGGSLKADVVQERVRAAIRHWFGEKDEARPIKLENPDPDVAVARGAAYYGLVKMGRGVRVGSGSPRAYFLGVAAEGPAAAEGGRPAVCLVERGLDEGSRIDLPGREFEVLANQPVSFDLYSSSFRSGDRCGDLVTVDETLTPLPPVQTVVQFGKKGKETRIPVRMEAEYTEVGTLALWCRSAVTDHRWKFQFQLRDAAAPGEVLEGEVFDESVVAQARECVRETFAGTPDGRRLEGIIREITAVVERPREKWPLSLIRTLADDLLELADARNAGPKAESRWLNLTGFCLRPGFGEGFDPHRVKAIWKRYHGGPVHPGHAQVRSEWWILWRRVAGGLTPGQQRQFIQDLTPIIFPKKTDKGGVSPQEKLEIWMTVANMERLLAKDKVKYGRALLAEITPKKAKPQHFWSLSRLGARELLYGPADRVAPPEKAAEWCRTLVDTPWRNPKPVAAALAQMARLTGDRVRDLSEADRALVLEWLETHNFSEPYRRMLETVVPIETQEETAIFGESLPSGLILTA
ncbi:MAG: Hsp70 family protein [Desulfococcaceae bacterium]